MIIDEASLTTVLLIFTTLLLGAASLAMLRFQRLVRTLGIPGKGAGGEPAADQREPVERRISALQKIVDDLARKEAAPPRTGRQDMPIENAVRMAKCGAGIEELTRSCGLKRGEAELLLRLHANREQTARTH